MGCLCSKPEVNGLSILEQRNAGNARQSAAAPQEAEAPIPDFGMDETYTAHKWLGQGGTGDTYLCKVKGSDDTVAIKYIRRPLAKALVPMIKAEIEIQAQLCDGHVCLVRSKEVILTHSHIGLVMEYARGGTLTAYVSNRWNTTHKRNGLFLDEDEARYFFRQFMLAVEYCHKNKVAHRDLKLDNTLLDGSDPPRIKICDFGFARAWDGEAANMHTQIGTPVYMSPEIINAKHNNEGYDAKRTDVWACGVLLFVMLAGMFPFEHQEHPDPNSSAAHIEVRLQQMQGSWREHERIAALAKKLTPECCDLLDKMFALETEMRPDITTIKQHPWYVKPLPPNMQKALQELEADQKVLEDHVASGGTKDPKREMRLDALLNVAQEEGKRGDPMAVVSLVHSSSPIPFPSKAAAAATAAKVEDITVTVESAA